MRKLSHYNLSSFSFYNSVVGSKRKKKNDPDFHERLDSYSNDVQILFQNYDNLFSKNTLHEISASLIDGQNKLDLLDLYQYQNSKLKELKKIVTTVDDNRELNTCQNCTIDPVSSFDHVIPKDDYPEYSVHPFNLFPSCDTCNKKKGVRWKSEHGRLFLNLYLDHLPQDQYLFCTVDFDGGKTEVTFEVRNEGNISNSLFALIKSHYDRLDLCNRFSQNSYTIVAEMEMSVKNSLRNQSIEQIQNVTLKTNQDFRNIFGHNHWMTILKDSLITNDSFLNYVRSQLAIEKFGV